MDPDAPRADLIRRPSAEDGINIPAPGNPALAARGLNPGAITGPLAAVQIVKDHGTGQILVANRCCRIGDVIDVTPHPTDGEGRKLRLGGDAMATLFFEEHALRLIKDGYAIPARPQPRPRGGDVERATDPAPARAAKAVDRPQQARPGAI